MHTSQVSEYGVVAQNNSAAEVALVDAASAEPVLSEESDPVQGKEGERREEKFNAVEDRTRSENRKEVVGREDSHGTLSDPEGEDEPNALAKQKQYNSEPESKPTSRDDCDWEVLSMTNQSISGIFRCGEENLFISFIYAKCNSIERRELWQSLELVDSKEDPWLVVGDFNVIREDSERVGGHPRPIRAMEEFNNCIDHCGLLDMQVTGRRLSWCNGHEGHTRSWARLDRALINIHYANRFPSACFEYLNRKTSDHCPMLIHAQKQEVGYGPHPFRFQNMWVTHTEFRRCVEEVWKEPTNFVGLSRLAEKLKKTKFALRAWNRKVFGHVGQNIKELEERLEVLDSHLQGGYDKEVECDYLVTKLELDIWEKREELRLSQLAKQKWLSEGDQNSKFFHAVVNQKRKSNVISHMRLENGTSLNSTEQVHQGALKYFQDFLSNPSLAEQVDLTPLIQKSVSEENNLALLLAPTETEVLTALKSIPKESSPGPDGFGSGFYLSCWELIKEDVLDAAKDFFSVHYVSPKRMLMRAAGFVEGKFPFTYLGVPMVSGRLTSRHLEPLVEQVRRRIAGWKSKLLSQGGRLTLMKHVLTCMSTHLLAVLNVPMKVFSRLNSLMATFFWGDTNGKQKMKWCAWDRICKPYKEGGLGIRNFHEVQRALHMKFAWRLVTVDNLWTKFFRAKYVKQGHIFLAETRRNASRFWKSIMKVFPEVAENVLVKVREGSSSFWFDRWLASGPLGASRESGPSQLKIKDVWIDGSWDENVLVDLVGINKTEEIMNGVVAGKVGTDITIWKPEVKGVFTSAPAWDLIRVKGRASWHGLDRITIFRGKISVCMWKARFNGLALWTLGCKGLESQVWKKAAIMLGMNYAQGLPWWLPVMQWFNAATQSSHRGVLLGLIPSIISWRLWRCRCKARMENSAESAESVWLAVRVWCLMWGGHGIFKLVYWRRPAEGWIKANVDGDCWGNPNKLWRKEGTNNEAELKALIAGVSLCKELGFSQLNIESDSTLVVSWLSSRKCTAWYLWDYWDELLSLLREVHFIISHQFLEGNTAADFLARRGEEGNSITFLEFMSLPRELKGIIRMDKAGLPQLRRLT
ncbi:hypothetical protein Patl1_15029 [Pistacia atlantica]|uniref:Uncharacterized protein n=1 Tax=Pistacia atlantica TaxID=434234 RepID=A0ACC1B626_9ROSI|nr:hypothetical protein Patl1_15029 [Pistacia atlantica]